MMSCLHHASFATASVAEAFSAQVGQLSLYTKDPAVHEESLQMPLLASIFLRRGEVLGSGHGDVRDAVHMESVDFCG
jgi:hypothetical protein